MNMLAASTDSPKPAWIPRASLESTVPKRRPVTVPAAYSAPLEDGDASPFDGRPAPVLIDQTGLNKVNLVSTEPAFRFELKTPRGQVPLEWVARDESVRRQGASERHRADSKAGSA